VLFNLVGNAVKFTERGGVVIRVRSHGSGQGTAGLRFEVIDSGIGMEPDTAARLFTPFTQADTSIARRFGGTGLGLSISKRLVELMCGTIGVTSKPGTGSTFWFELPVEAVSRSLAPDVDANRAANATGTDQTVPRLSGLRILVVDDSALNRMLVERALKLEGAMSVQAVNGQQALELLKAEPQGFDAVLMDMLMPVMDGVTATRAIRQELKLETLPVIALTAGVMAEEKQKALDAGMTDFLVKPMDIKLLAEVISLHCSGSRPISSL
jgi:CheY-like chemotaxis protein